MRAFLALLAFITAAHAEDAPGAWWQRQGVRACCSLADAVYADEYHVEGGKLFVTVTGGGPRDHAWAPIGRTYIVPADALKNEPGNPTGHGILFLNPSNLEVVHCFLPGAGT